MNDVHPSVCGFRIPFPVGARSFLLVLALNVVSVLPAQAQSRWVVVESAPETNLRQRHDDIGFSGPDNGWLVNTRGQIWATRDGGSSWSAQVDNPTTLFRSVAPVTDRLVFAGTVHSPASVLFASTDSGDTWTDISNRISGSRPEGICGMSVVSERVVYGVGAYHGAATMIKTENGGATWVGKSLRSLAATLVDVHFFDNEHGVAVGGTSDELMGNAVVLVTSDGGDTWNRVFESSRASGVPGEWAWKISFPTREVGYVSIEYLNNPEGQEAKILKTEDGGLSWREIRVAGSVSRAGLQGVGFISPEVGWTSGRGVTSVTRDGGNTWDQIVPWGPQVTMNGLGDVIASPEGQLDGSVNRIIVLSDTLALAVGRRLYRLELGERATNVAWEAPPESFALTAPYPNPSEEGVTLELTLGDHSSVQLEIIDVLGRRIRDYPARFLAPGRHAVSWDGRTETGERPPAGTYFLLVSVEGSPEMKQVVLLR